MSRKLSFEFDPRKFANASAYLVERCSEVTRMKLAKLLYFADKLHLIRYGQPIIGDRYFKMEWGPVPSNGYNVIKHDAERAGIEAVWLFESYLADDGRNITLRTPPNMRYLSETNREVLDDVIKKLGHLTPSQLSALSHREPSWQKAQMNAEMDYRLMFTESSDARAMLDLAQEDQQLKDALSDVEIEEILESLHS